MYVIWPTTKDEDFRFEFHKTTGHKLKGLLLRNSDETLSAMEVEDEEVTNRDMNSLISNPYFGESVYFSLFLPSFWSL